MNYDDMAPTADKWLHANGSVTTMAGDIIHPAHPDRARDYASRSPQAAKWLLPDGSIVNSMPGGGGGSPGELPPTYYRAWCDTVGTESVKILTGLPDGYTPANSDILLIQFNGTANLARNIKFTITGSVTQYEVLFNGLATTLDASAWKPGGVFPFYFDGTSFHQLSYSKEYDNNTTYTGFFQQHIASTKLRTGARGFDRYQFALERLDGAFDKPYTVTSSTASDKQVDITADFKVDGLIIYNSSTTSYYANAAHIMTNIILIQFWQQSNIFDYALNGNEHLTQHSWVYLVGIPQQNPMLYRLDPGSPTSWYTTTIPTTDDGKVYIKLGYFADAAQFSLFSDHPAYWFKDGYFRPYLTRGDVS